MTIQEKMHSGALYLPMDEALFREQLGWLDRLWEFNATRPSQLEKREALLRELFAEIGEGCYIEPPLHANWGGRHVHFGRNIYANFNLTLVDDTHIYVGDNTMFGPNVVVATAGHPLLPELREQGYQYNAPVHIGSGAGHGYSRVAAALSGRSWAHGFPPALREHHKQRRKTPYSRQSAGCTGFLSCRERDHGGFFIGRGCRSSGP